MQLNQTELVPRWMIRKVCEQNGQRLPKRELWKSPEVAAAIVPFNQIRTVENAVIERQKQCLSDKKFEFENWEYRFWCVEIMDGAPTLAYCRRCSSTFFHKKPRREHLGANGCTKVLLEAYKLLLRDRKCVICDLLTTHTEWGVPLCNKNYCKDRFMHDDMQPAAIENALLLIENSELLKR